MGGVVFALLIIDVDGGDKAKLDQEVLTGRAFVSGFCGELFSLFDTNSATFKIKSSCGDSEIVPDPD